MKFRSQPMVRLFILLLVISVLSFTAYADDAPVFTVNTPSTATAVEGGTLSLSVTVTGQDLSYQWYKNDMPVEGQTGPSFTEAGITSASEGARYYCYVQNPFGGVSSNTCVLSIVRQPMIVQDISATSLTVNKGDLITLSASASGGNLMIRWFYATPSGDYTVIPGQTGSTLSIPAEDVYNNNFIYCEFINDAGSVKSGRCRITVNGVTVTPTPAPTASPTPAPDPPVITKDPIEEPPVDEGGTVIFIARADNTETYRWRFISPDGSSRVEYDRITSQFPGLQVYGGDTETITLANIPFEMDGWKVACMFTNAGGSVVSKEALLQVEKNASTLSIITQPKGDTMAIDEREDFFLTIEASASKGGSISYQWYSAGVNSAAAMQTIPGATFSSYKPERTVGTRFYRVAVTLTDRGVTSEPIFSSICAVTFTDSNAHVHSYSSVWEANDISHWHQCTCGDHADEAFHTYEWTVIKPATAAEDGEQQGVCAICGHETVQPIPAGSMAEEQPAEQQETAAPSKRLGVNFVLTLLGILAVGIIAGAALLIRHILRSDDEDDDDGGQEK